jgi:hypothetical protein
MLVHKSPIFVITFNKSGYSDQLVSLLKHCI